MSISTPTTSVIRCVATNWNVKTKKKNFDRWLAEVKAEAWDEGFTCGETYADNPYRQEGE